MVVNSRIKVVKNALKNSFPWALSGSMAMRLYGQKYNVNTREPANLNIVVNRNNIQSAYNILKPMSNGTSRSPPPLFKRANKIHYALKPKYDILV